MCNPGGFPNFEHRWALADAFHFTSCLGKKNIQQKISSLADFCKKKLKKLPGIKLYTPLQKKLSSGLICFDVVGCDPTKIVDAMYKKSHDRSNPL